MICLIAGNYHEAKQFARANLLDDNEWFCPTSAEDILGRSNFHVIVVGTAGMNTPASYFNRILELAQQRGRIGRG